MRGFHESPLPVYLKQSLGFKDNNMYEKMKMQEPNMITGSWVWSECGAATYILLFTNKDKTRKHRLL